MKIPLLFIFIMTISDYLTGKVAFTVDPSAVLTICADRGCISTDDVSQLNQQTKDLLFADILKWGYTKPSTVVGAQQKHGNFTLTAQGESFSEKRKYLNMANVIYKKYNDPAYYRGATIKDVTDRW